MRIIDMHAHLWLGRTEENHRELLEAVEEVPLDRLYVSGLAGELPTPEQTRQANDAVHRLMNDSSRVGGMAYLNPRHGAAALEELARCLDLGFCGVKLWIATLADDPLNFPVYEAAIRHCLPVLLHAFDKSAGQQAYESRPWQVAEAARRYPEGRFIMAHLAGDFVSGSDWIADLPNVYADISGSYGETGMVEYAVERLGAARVLFGTDMPASDLYHNLGKVTGARISEPDKDAILSANAERIFP